MVGQALPILAQAVEDRPTDRLAWDLLLNLGELDAAAEYIPQMLALQKELVAEQSVTAERRAELAGIHLAIGKTLDNLGRADFAIPRLEMVRGFYEVSGDLLTGQSAIPGRAGRDFHGAGPSLLAFGPAGRQRSGVGSGPA